MKLNWINKQNSIARSVALGTFDGVHRGHQKLLEASMAYKPQGGSSSVFTFDLPPEQYFQGQLRLVSTFEQKVERILNFGIDEVAWLPFGAEAASLEASDFVKKILVEKLQAKQVICGFNYRFGHKRGGDVPFLQEQGRRFGFEVIMIPPVQGQGGEIISSTLIRKLITQGDLKQASEYLGYYPTYQGIVVHGEGRGQKLGFPTANLQMNPSVVLPSEGVYLTWCTLPERGGSNGQGAPAVTSIGRNPTFAGTMQTVEAFILDFSADLYGQTLGVQFLTKIRDIVRYESPSQLQEQIHSDVVCARRLLDGFHLQDAKVVLK